jgi:hypothetical protein
MVWVVLLSIIAMDMENAVLWHQHANVMKDGVLLRMSQYRDPMTVRKELVLQGSHSQTSQQSMESRII